MKNLKPEILMTILYFIIGAFVMVSCGSSKEHNHEIGDETEHINADMEHNHNQSSSSPRKSAMANVGNSHIHIDYSAPSVKGRVIWGGLVAHDQLWVTGAHKATSIDFPNDVIINGEEIPFGKYALFTIPGQSEWTIILNRNWDQHLTDDYDQSLDILRFMVSPESLNKIEEELIYTVSDNGDNIGTISMSWEKLKISFDFTVIE